MSDAPKQIWAVDQTAWGAIRGGSWADTIRQCPDGVEYVRADELRLAVEAARADERLQCARRANKVPLFGNIAAEQHASLEMACAIRDAILSTSDVFMLTSAFAAIQGPAEPGGFIGDIYFGDPDNSTRGTHRWDGTGWVALPTDNETLCALLAKSRAELSEARAKHDALHGAVAVIANECSWDKKSRAIAHKLHDVLAREAHNGK